MRLDPTDTAPWDAIVTAARHAIAEAATVAELGDIRIRYLGRKGELTMALRAVGQLPPERRPAAGQAANVARAAVERALEAAAAALGASERQRRLAAEAIDITLPGRPPGIGHPHPLVIVRQDMERIFASMGFVVADGPEIEDEWHNFEALNIPAEHPAREMQDSFFIDHPPLDPNDDRVLGRLLLRTQTSPVQIRTMRAQQGRLPVRMVAPGRVYRRDDDATHSPMFHQFEGLLVDRGVSFSHLKGVLQSFAHRLYGGDTSIRFRPSYFPFTEPSAEVDVTCVFCHGQGCRTCKQSGWIEVLGAGMVHPRVLMAGGYDPEEVSGFAFGVGIERLAMLRYRIEDIRAFYEGDMRFGEQF